MEFTCPVTPQLVLALDLLRAAHGSRLIDAEHHRDILLTLSLFILNLCSSFQDEVNSLVFRLLLLFQIDIVLMIAELTDPDLVAVLILLLLHLTVNVEDSLTLLALSGISRSKLSLISEGLKPNPIDVGINLLTEQPGRCLLVRSLLEFLLGPELLDPGLVLAVRQLQLTLELVRVHFLARSVSLIVVVTVFAITGCFE